MIYQGFCWLYWELPPNLHVNWEILSTFLLTKYEFEINLGNNKQNNFAVEFISLNYNIMYLSFSFLNLSTNVSILLSDSLSFPSIDHIKSFQIHLGQSLPQKSFNQIHIWKAPFHRGRDDIHQVKDGWISGICLKKFTIFTQITWYDLIQLYLI